MPGSRGLVTAPRFLPVRNGKQRGGWKRFLTRAVRRYGPRGSFWAENPQLPKRPIRNWQIWNEANFKYFVVRPNPAEYGKLVKLSYAAIKAPTAAPGWSSAGSSRARPRRCSSAGRGRPTSPADFLDQMYRRTPG